MSNTFVIPDVQPTETSDRRAGSFYRPELDAVRFVAFFLVFLHHTFPRSPKDFPVFGDGLVVLVNGAGFGLQLFFMLSAYLVCELLLREKSRTGHVDMGRFYKRRMLRIWPLYFLGLGISLFFILAQGTLKAETPWLAACVLMVANVYVGLHGYDIHGLFCPLWSISIEEQFYVAWPSVAKFCSERNIRFVAWTVIAIANGALIYFGIRHANVDNTVWTNSFVEFYMFGSGILLSVYLKGRMLILGTAARFGLVAGALVCWFVAVYVCHIKDLDGTASAAHLVIGYALLASGCVGVMLAFMGITHVPKGIAYLGRISYGLYVFHMLAIYLASVVLSGTIGRNWFYRAILALPITLGLAALSYKYFEGPFLRLKDRSAVIHSQPVPQ
jgi:peptidoglycan/LPS O-acetylase OafA/YrhL